MGEERSWSERECGKGVGEERNGRGRKQERKRMVGWEWERKGVGEEGRGGKGEERRVGREWERKVVGEERSESGRGREGGKGVGEERRWSERELERKGGWEGSGRGG